MTHNTPEPEDLYQVFCKNPFFDNFEKEHFIKFISMGRFETHENNAFIFQKDDESLAMYLVLEGLINVVSISEDGKEALLNRIYPGGIIGEIGLVDGGTRTASAYCSKKSKLFAISKSNFFKFLEDHPKVYQTIISQLCSYIRLNTEVIEDVLFSNRYQKLGKKLLKIIEIEKPKDNVINISQEELANMLGLSREIVNKSLQDFQKRQLITLKRSKIEVIDEQGIKNIILGGQI